MQQTQTYSNIALEIQFRHMPKSNALMRIAEQQLDAFDSSAVRGSRCTIVFDQSHSSEHDPVCQVTIRLHIPGQRLYVAHTTESGNSKDLLFAALNDAFSNLRRQMLKTRTKRYRHRRIAA